MRNSIKEIDSQIIRKTIYIYIGIIVTWTFVWFFKISILDNYFKWFATNAGSFLWWTLAKLFIWILPAIRLMHFSNRTLREVFNIFNWKNILQWGGGIGILIAFAGMIPNYLNGNSILPTEWKLSLLNVLFIAPIFEEFLVRGALFGNLQKNFSFWIANIISALMFVGMHIPGWYFMGSLVKNMTHPFGGVLSLFLLGLVFGYTTYKSRSVIGGMFVHFINNLVTFT